MRRPVHGGGQVLLGPPHVQKKTPRCPPCSDRRGEATQQASQSSSHSPTSPGACATAQGRTLRRPLSSLRTCPDASGSAEDSEDCARSNWSCWLSPTELPQQAPWPTPVSECNAQRRRPPRSGTGAVEMALVFTTEHRLGGRPCQSTAVSPGASDAVASRLRTKFPPPDSRRPQWGGPVVQLAGEQTSPHDVAPERRVLTQLAGVQV